MPTAPASSPIEPSIIPYRTFAKFDEHMRTNCIGPIITAQKLLKTNVPIGMLVFMSSDSASATNFLAHEDGFAAYAASKAALNHTLRVRHHQHPNLSPH